MPVPEQYNEVKNEPLVTLTPGNYNFQIIDIDAQVGVQSQWGEKDQYTFYVACLDGEDRGKVIRMFISMSFNPGFDKGQPSWLFLLSKSVLKKNLDGSEVVKVNSLINGLFNGHVKVNSKGFPVVKGYDRVDENVQSLTETELVDAKTRVEELIVKKQRKAGQEVEENYDESVDVGKTVSSENGGNIDW